MLYFRATGVVHAGADVGAAAAVAVSVAHSSTVASAEQAEVDLCAQRVGGVIHAVKGKQTVRKCLMKGASEGVVT